MDEIKPEEQKLQDAGQRHLPPSNHKTYGATTPSKPSGAGVHPAASLILGFSILIFSFCLAADGLQAPIEKMPKELRSWPSVTATVAHSVRRVSYGNRGGSQVYNDMTFVYKISDHDYWFNEFGVDAPIASSEVKYDPKIPFHYYRVPAKSEHWEEVLFGALMFIPGVFALIVGTNKMRAGERYCEPIITGIVLFFALIFGWVDYQFLFNPDRIQYPKTPYKLADTQDPVKLLDLDR